MPKNDTAPQQTFAEFVANERDRINAARGPIMEQRRELDYRLAELDQELEAIAAYESARRMPPRTTTQPRAQRTSRRDDILNALQAHPAGYTRNELLTALRLEGKSAAMSVSNALTALVKLGTIIRTGRTYTLAPPT